MRVVLAAFVVALLPASASAVRPRDSAVVLLRDGRVLRISIPEGHRLAEQRLRVRSAPTIEGGRLIAVRSHAIYVVIPSEPGVIASLARGSLRLRWRRTLDPHVSYRALVLAGTRLYAFGYRPGRIIDKEFRYRETSAVVTVFGTGGAHLGSETIRRADGHDWWEWWASSTPDGRRLAIAWHGGCGPNSGSLCTTGADVVDLNGNGVEACTARGKWSNAGCISTGVGRLE